MKRSSLPDHTPQVIFALATGPSRAAIAIMRASGPGSDTILRALCN